MSDRGLPRRRSLRNRLALGFFAVTALALAAAMFVFLPQLATKIENQKLDDLQQVAEASAPRLDRVIGRDVTGPQIDALVRTLSDRTSARVTLLGLQQSSGPFLPQFYVITDSNQTSEGTPNYALARRALAARAPGSAVRARSSQSRGPVSRYQQVVSQSTSASTASGWATASACAAMPPIDSPTTTARSTPAACSTP